VRTFFGQEGDFLNADNRTFLQKIQIFSKIMVRPHRHEVGSLKKHRHLRDKDGGQVFMILSGRLL